MPPPIDLGRFVSRVSLCAALVAGVGSAACSKKPVMVLADPPPLSVPAVPPRLVGPVQVEDAAPPPVDEAPERPAPRTTARAPRVTRSEPQTRPPDAASPPVEAARTEGAEPPAPVGDAAPNLLRTPETADDREATRRVREIIGRAATNLSKVNYKALSNASRAQHDTATRLIAQAEDALKTRSFIFARYLADKAEVLSGSLVNR